MEEEEDDNDEGQDLDDGSTRYEDRVFKDKDIKTNLPRNHPVPAALSACIAATRFAILGAPLNNKQPNISPEVRAGGQDLVALQREREYLSLNHPTRQEGTASWTLMTTKRAWMKS